MLVEVFNTSAYFTALEKGIQYPMLSVKEKGLFINLYYLLNGNITMLVCPARYVDRYPRLFTFLHNRGVNIFVYTSNDKDFIKENLGVKVVGIYTDTVLPSEIE